MEVIFDNVSYAYQAGTPLEHEVLKELNVKIEKGKITGIIGPTGSGKTTFIGHINALLLPVKGKVVVGDFVLENKLKRYNLNLLRFDVSLVFQFPEEQFFQPTVKQELEFGMQFFNYKLDKTDERISQALQMVGLDDSFLNRNPFELSNGEKRRVAIASILVFNPKIIILDEPTVGLDNNGKKLLIHLIRKLKYMYNKTVIIVSHDVDMLYKFVDNIIILKEGRILCSGKKYEVFENIKLLKNNNINMPKIVEFNNKVYSKMGFNLGKYSEINDLIKMIYKNV